MAWQVTAEMVVVPANTPFGPQMVHVNRYGLLPEGVPQDRITHLLSVKMIRSVDGVAPPAPRRDDVPVVAAAEPAAVDGGPAVPGAQDSVPFDDPDRVAAREKLPAEGLPHHSAGHPVWVEAAVKAGYAYNEAVKSSKDDLRELLKK